PQVNGVHRAEAIKEARQLVGFDGQAHEWHSLRGRSCQDLTNRERVDPPSPSANCREQAGARLAASLERARDVALARGSRLQGGVGSSIAGAGGCAFLGGRRPPVPARGGYRPWQLPPGGETRGNHPPPPRL